MRIEIEVTARLPATKRKATVTWRKQSAAKKKRAATWSKR
jgi:hypothetical protein